MVTTTSMCGIDDERDDVERYKAGPDSGLTYFATGRPILKLKTGLTVTDMVKSLSESTIDRPVPVWLRREWGDSPLPVVITELRSQHEYPEPDVSLNFWFAAGHVAGSDRSYDPQVRIKAVGKSPAESGEIDSYMWQIATDEPIGSEDEYVVVYLEQ